MTIDPALGLTLEQRRTIDSRRAGVDIVLPAHNEQDTVVEAVEAARAALDHLGVAGTVIVSASGCTDATEALAHSAGAVVVSAPLGKGRAIQAGVAAGTADVVCLVDADLRYFGQPPIAAVLVEPILRGLADVTVADLYWRPVYPQLWLYGFFAPLAGRLFPELTAKVGTTPWSGQRAALRTLWPTELPAGFTSDLALLLHWNDLGVRMRPVLADDWTNPQRPKPDLLRQEFELMRDHAVRRGRLRAGESLDGWFDTVHAHMATYRPGVDDPVRFERSLLELSVAAGPEAGGHTIPRTQP